MRGNNQRQIGDKLSMTLSIFIALCVVSIFCAISIIIVENIDSLAENHKNKRISLPHTRDVTGLSL
jgi:hypothetical protein